MSLAKFDELDSLIRGMLYIETTNPHECYYWSHPTDEEKCQRIPFDFSEPYPFVVSQLLQKTFNSSFNFVSRLFQLVNIGSGVSILAVFGPNNYKRISGTR